MKKLSITLLGTLALASCADSTPEERAAEAKGIEDKARSRGFEDNLPPGCKLLVPGRVNGDVVVVIVCDRRVTTSATRSWRYYDQPTKQYRTRQNHVIYIEPEA